MELLKIERRDAPSSGKELVSCIWSRSRRHHQAPGAFSTPTKPWESQRFYLQPAADGQYYLTRSASFELDIAPPREIRGMRDIAQT